ncbi:MAG: amidohydrolase family protein [Acidobacteriota bacterium]|nr:amidohydrolase family protein [Acidobacteriota bacterium]MDH3785066.1 amidohydrolase family protein [Acidobacteriota bacterium]
MRDSIRLTRWSVLGLTTILLWAVLAPGSVLAKKKKDKPEETTEAEEPWDVQAPGGPVYEAKLDTDTGTWMNLDVSPDGEHVMFDLLGDLYEIPIAGGDAVSLTDGFAWDMHPRYSPDGSSIAFTSDRGGGDNIWIMDRDGSDPQAVSEESYRLLNNPVWSPDGEFLAARKHFTSRRSLGSGEIWLFHRSGGAGIQLNEKPNEQKDLGEPAFSPDGRYIYFSQDTTSGSVFQYNKDSNTQIYTIQRIDREEGRIETVISGAGGAARPTPSPDGKWVAFVRRVRFDTCLFLHDTDSGRNTKLTCDLERDMQETWAVHGVYPNMAWTPDSDSLVYWATGTLHRIEIDSREITPIPFRVKDKREMVEALRFPVAVAPDQFDVKMLRWVQVSPAGDRVLFQALGKLWVRDLPDGEPTRLTLQDDHFEFYPSFSRDGRWVVYTTWHDEELSTIQIAASDGTSVKTLDVGPGHYIEPVFSPDGKTVVYRKIGGGFIRSGLYSQETGIYSIGLNGGKPVRVTRNGRSPQFAADGSRLFFTTSEAEDRRALRSIDLDGTDEHEHVNSEAAVEFSLSPDGQWLAFSERFKTYIAPFVATGKPMSLGPGSTSIPVRQVSRDSGDYLHWSGDSKTLHWSMGPELFSRDLKDAFAFYDGAPEELPEPQAEGVAIGFRFETDVPTGVVALVGARIITMRGDEVLERGTIVVEGNRIQTVGPTDEIDVPSGAKVIDVGGHTIIPGLVDVHWHGSQGTSEITPQRNWFNDAALAFGVTTAHDPSNDTSTFFAASELAKAGSIVGPRLYSTGMILYGASGSFKAIVDSEEDAAGHLRRMKAAGAFSVKSYNQPRREQRQQVISAARDLEMMVVPEGGSLFQHNMTMVVDGHTGVEHALPVANIYDDVLQLWSQSRTGYTPTLGVGYGGIWGENYWYAHTDVYANERLMEFVPRPFVDSVARRPFIAPEEEYNHISIAKGCKALTDVGVSVQLGAHGQREGLAAHWELWMFAQGGMTPLETLRAGTLNGAAYVGLDKDIGSIEVGKLADLAILAKNPLEEIRHTDSVVFTMINGRLFDAATMNQIGNHPDSRPPLFFKVHGEDVHAESIGCSCVRSHP